MKDLVENKKPGLYLYIIFPIAVTFLVAFVGSRIISHIDPDLYIPWSNQVHVHHFAYGFFILAASGYLALVFSGARAKYLIGLLYGLGLGLAFDEYGIWLHLSDTDPARFSYDGLIIIVASVFFIVSVRPGIKMIGKLWPFKGQNRPF